MSKFDPIEDLGELFFKLPRARSPGTQLLYLGFEVSDGREVHAVHSDPHLVPLVLCDFFAVAI